METIFNRIFLEHDTGTHPENKNRLLYQKNLINSEIEFNESVVSKIHSQSYIDMIKKYSAAQTPLDPDTQLSEKSYEAAIYGANATIKAQETNSIALVRPPGHHAYKNKGTGFCIFNNIAIAVQNLVDQGKRVLIFDFDGHFGDGTSDIFYNSDKVLFISTHQHPAFPGKGILENIGNEKGEGFNINIPLPAGAGDDIYLDALDGLVLPVSKQFNPDVVAISAGFDAHFNDPMLDLRFSTESFYKTGECLTENFGNIFAVLEGGYNPEYLRYSIDAFIDGINKNETKMKDSHTDSTPLAWNEYEVNFSLLIQKLKKHWKV